MRLLVLIFTCKKYFHRCTDILKTWGQDLIDNNIDFYFVSGDNLSVDPFLKIKFKECYEQLPLKTYITLSTIKHYDYTHILKTDDDTFLNVHTLLKNTSKLMNLDYIGKFNLQNTDAKHIHYFKCNAEYQVPKKISKSNYAEGGFYILSKKAVNHIASAPENLFINTPSTYKGEDVLVGKLLENNFKKLDIKDKMSDIMNMDITTKGISLHPVDTKLFLNLHRRTFSKQLELLKKNSNLNEYNIRDSFLKQLKI